MVLNKKMISKYCCGEDVQEIGPGPIQTMSQKFAYTAYTILQGT